MAPLFRIREASLLASPLRVAGRLFFYYLDLPVDYLPGKPVNRNVHPVALLAIHHELVQTGGVRWIASALRDDIDHKIPSSRLEGVGEGAQDALTCFFVAQTSNILRIRVRWIGCDACDSTDQFRFVLDRVICSHRN